MEYKKIWPERAIDAVRGWPAFVGVPVVVLVITVAFVEFALIGILLLAWHRLTMKTGEFVEEAANPKGNSFL